MKSKADGTGSHWNKIKKKFPNQGKKKGRGGKKFVWFPQISTEEEAKNSRGTGLMRRVFLILGVEKGGYSLGRGGKRHVQKHKITWGDRV